MERLVHEFVDSHIESLAARNERLTKLKFDIHRKKKEAAAKRDMNRAVRSAYLSRVVIRFDTDDEWTKALLIEQAEGRGLKSCQNWTKDALVEAIGKWNREQTLAQLEQFLVQRSIRIAFSTPVKALRKLHEHDDKLEYPQSARTVSDEAGGGEELPSDCEYDISTDSDDSDDCDDSPVSPPEPVGMRKRKRR
eukprot:Hpha_TRINITY_DN16354_c5_g1::TRINITY_DN16354_c5_g1_i4::g.60395::m.60395